MFIGYGWLLYVTNISVSWQVVTPAVCTMPVGASNKKRPPQKYGTAS